MAAGGWGIKQILQWGLAAFLVLLVLAIYPYTNDPSGDIKRFLIACAVSGMSLLWLYGFLTGSLHLRRPRIFPELLGLLLLFLGASMLFSEYRWISFLEWQRFLMLGFLYFLVTQTFDSFEEMLPVLLAFCVAVGIAAAYGFLQLTGLDPFPWADRESDVYTGLPATFGHPNFAAHTLVIAIPLALYFAATGTRWCWGLLATYVFHLMLTGQRAGWIALAAGLLLVLVCLAVRVVVRRPVSGVIVTLIITAILGAAGLFSAMYVTNLRTGTPFPLDVSLLIRYQSYVSATNMILDAPLLGHGPGVYEVTYGEYWTPFEQQWFAQYRRMNDHVHNDLLELGVDGGLPAAGAYLALLVLGMAYSLLIAFTSEVRQRRWLGLTLGAIFMAFFVDGLFGFNLRVPVSGAMFFVLLAVVEVLWPRARLLAPPVAARFAALGAVAAAVVCVVFATLVFASENRMNRGMSRQALQEYDLAERRFRAGQELAPWNGHFERRLGELKFAQRDMAGAIAHYERALALLPDYVLTRLPLAQSQIMLAQSRETPHLDDKLRLLQEAANHAEAVLALVPQMAAAEGVLGQVAFLSAAYVSGAEDSATRQHAREYWAHAEEHLQRAIDFGTAQSDKDYRMLAQTRIALNQLEEAEEAIVRAVQSDPGNRESWALFLDFAQKHRRYERLRETLYTQLARLREKDPIDGHALATAYLLLANVLENGEGELVSASRAYTSAVGYAPELPEVWINFARFAFEHGQTQLLREQVVASARALEERGEKPLPHLAALNGVFQQGPSALPAATATLLANARAYGNAGGLSAGQVFGWAARLLLEYAGQQEGDAACQAFLDLGITFTSLGEYLIADNALEKAAACLPEGMQPVVALHRGNNLLALERNRDALVLFGQARDKYSQDFELRWGYARALSRNGLVDAARDEYNQLLQEESISASGREMLQRELKALDEQAQ